MQLKFLENFSKLDGFEQESWFKSVETPIIELPNDYDYTSQRTYPLSNPLILCFI